jgi:23S rRNA pseudouridine1911/1915/1917 synthase
LSRESEPDRRRLHVGEEPARRLDAWIALQLPELSRSRVAQLIDDGRVRRNGRIPKKRDIPQPGDVIDIEIPPPEPAWLLPEPIPLDIVHEDDDLLVVDKPAGLVVHPAPGHRTGTLVNALLHHVGELTSVGGVRRPGIVHRLDKQTSGLMLVARTDSAHRALSAALKQRKVRRAYLAAAWGHIAHDELTVDAPIGRSAGDRKRMGVVAGGRNAVTHFRRVERWVAADLLEARLETGRTHQIRVHLMSIGHPVVGDPDYGGGGERGVSGPGRTWARELSRRVPRQFLHAWELEFRHPRTGEALQFRSPLPPDLASAAEWARAEPGR